MFCKKVYYKIRESRGKVTKNPTNDKIKKKKLSEE